MPVIALEKQTPICEPRPAQLPEVPCSPVDDEAGLVTTNLPLVRYIVRDMLGRLPNHVDRSELMSAGSLALLQALRSWDDSRGVPFTRFAALRIRGAVLDELRSRDWASRSVRSRAREIDTARGELREQLGRPGSSAEVATAAGVSEGVLAASDADVVRASVLSLQGLADTQGVVVPTDATQGPEETIVRREELGVLHDGIAELPAHLTHVVKEYFFCDRQMSDIADELGVTESRVSQMRAEAVSLLREGMLSHRNPDRVVAVGAGPRVGAQRRAYVEAVKYRSTLTARLACTTTMGDLRCSPFA